MKIVAFIPYWFGYNSKDDDKGMKKLAGKYLINYSIEQIKNCNLIDDIIIFSSDKKILDFIEDKDVVTYLKRPEYLDSKEIRIEQIIEEFLKVNEVDIVVLIHPNSPFLTSKTISRCIEKVKTDKYDSSFIAYKFNKLAWYKDKPLNYTLEKETPHMDEIVPVILELSSIYVFEKKMFLKKKRRIGDNPFIMYVDHFEGHDINGKEDFEMAELIVNSGMYPKV